MMTQVFVVVTLSSRLFIPEVLKKPTSRFKCHGILVAVFHDLSKGSFQVIFIIGTGREVIYRGR
jgi:hypothetical protein